MEISGTKTVKDWLELKPRLLVEPIDEQAWNQGIDFYDLRIRSRYINPINAIRSYKHTNNLKGEGFAICTLICSMIESIETFYQGRTFASKPNEKKYEFGSGESRRIFTSFLTQRSPFDNYFDQDLANDFYWNVRCSLLHEACTRGGWKINIREHETITVTGHSKIINRSLLLSDLEKTMTDYKALLLDHSNQYRVAFVRKFDMICQNSTTDK